MKFVSSATEGESKLLVLNMKFLMCYAEVGLVKPQV